MVDVPALTAVRQCEPTGIVSRFLPLHAAVYGTLMAMDRRTSVTTLCAVSLWVVAMGALRFPVVRSMPFLVCLLMTGSIFPEVPNHGYVFCAALLATALFRAGLREEEIALASGYRYLVAIVFFWSGMQKFLAGTWTQSQFLIYEIGHSERFGRAVGWLATRAEQRAYRIGGPFSSHGPLMLVSNFVWIAEIVIALGLLSAQSVLQKRAAWAALVLLVGVEFVARESVFGLLVAGLLWPTIDKRFSLRWLWLIVPIELLAIGGRLSLVPGGFH
jgi:hypothetical protein